MFPFYLILLFIIKDACKYKQATSTAVQQLTSFVTLLSHLVERNNTRAMSYIPMMIDAAHESPTFVDIDVAYDELLWII